MQEEKEKLRTVEECDKRYFGITEKLSVTNTLIRVIVWIVVFTFPAMTGGVVYIYKTLDAIQIAIIDHNWKNDLEIERLKHEIETIKLIYKK